MNPELQRNLWLEFSLHRLVVMPCVLALLFLCAALSTQPNPDVGITTTGLLLYIGLAGFWGARRAVLSQSCLFEAKCKNRVLQNQ